jgi:acetyltransferase-like isoleucine patch superfamily enzyme
MFNRFINLRKLKKKYKTVQFMSHSYFEFSDNITFKGYAYIGPDAYWSAKGKIEVGNNVIFGPRTILWTYTHNYMSENYIPYGKSDEDIIKNIIIEDNVWIGLGVTILPGVRIGEGAVIGMNSLVTKDIPSCAVVAGNPAKIIKYRDIKVYKKLKEENKLYLEYKYENY